MKPYISWVDFMEHLRHPESLINLIAAYDLRRLSRAFCASRWRASDALGEIYMVSPPVVPRNAAARGALEDWKRRRLSARAELPEPQARQPLE
jgi:hypothetical protein